LPFSQTRNPQRFGIGKEHFFLRAAILPQYESFQKGKMHPFRSKCRTRDPKRRKEQVASAHFLSVLLEKAEDGLDSSFHSVI